MRIAIQMDPLDSINPAGDSTLRIAQEAQNRGYELFCYTPDTLSMNGRKIIAHAQSLNIQLGNDPFYSVGKKEHLELATMDVVLLRQDPPFDMGYITSTYILEQLPQTTRVFNHPEFVRNLPEKIFPLQFEAFCPPTLISSDLQVLENFYAEHKEIILKPLYGYGGRSVILLREGDGNLPALLEMHTSTSNEPILAQKFLPEVRDQDRRIILIDGEIAGVVGRIPAEGEIRANFRVGGSAAKAHLTKRQHEICEAVKPVLKEKDLLFVGLDVIGDYLTEINITSPTGMAQINQLEGIKCEALFWDALESKL